ncbi:MAG: ABC transporter permease, partial [Actinomycetes bacterium]
MDEFVAWLPQHLSRVLDLTWRHAQLSAIPLLIGLVIALPLGLLARRYPRLYPPMVGVTGLLYTIPSLALFVALPALIGSQILDPVNVIVALSIYTVALLVRTVADGLAAVPEEVTRAATAMGFGRVRRFLQVELPIAVPVIGAGLRVAAVSNVSLVSVAALIGVPQLGQLMTDGFPLVSYPPIRWGVILCALLALERDLLILGAV